MARYISFSFSQIVRGGFCLLNRTTCIVMVLPPLVVFPDLRLWYVARSKLNGFTPGW